MKYSILWNITNMKDIIIFEYFNIKYINKLKYIMRIKFFNLDYYKKAILIYNILLFLWIWLLKYVNNFYHKRKFNLKIDEKFLYYKNFK